MVLEWLDATRHLRELRKASEAGEAFAKIIARCSNLDVAEVISDMKEVG